ncbi:purine/pyrimidine permease [Oceanisphaera arctica]|uniref:Xanthine/uracil/vitamin C permease n=1 Tax=Oceanisphaera arctica TaxID=641510 RepID=A0A2P5TQF2_9GAMM|nr:purine/pyrimidine permease [Oceanisphaera arctica]PPL17920.1 xanthine/uracil/vitamin C permease [Oceanisphaera arctica]GHA24033.1 xanthine permease [Oceanisphaera arctica]
MHARFGWGLSVSQWFIFLMANALALPIILGQAFGLDGGEIAGLMQRTLMLVGLSSLLQVALGHRYPIADGPAGSWAIVFVVMAYIGREQGHDSAETLQLLAGGVLVAGAIMLVLGLARQVHRLLFLFTPLVTGCFMLLLVIQLAGVFVRGMVTDPRSGMITLPVALVGLLVFVGVLLCSFSRHAPLRTYAVMVGIVAGWTAFVVFDLSAMTLPETASGLQWPELFAFGAPRLDSGMLVVAVLFSLLLFSNQIAAVSAITAVVSERQPDLDKVINRSSWASGMSHVMAGSLSTIAVVPLPVTAGFIQLTGDSRRGPFMLACVLLALVALFPQAVGFLSLLPAPVANAALLATFIKLVALAFQMLTRQPLDNRSSTIIGVALLLGVGCMFLPPELYRHLPGLAQYLLGNGLLTGTLLALTMEKLWAVKR